VQNLERKVEELESHIKKQRQDRSSRRARSAERIRGRSVERLREEPSILKSEHSRELMKKDKDNFRMLTGQMPSYQALKEFTAKICKILEVSTIYEIPPILVKLKKSYKDFQLAKKFISRISDIVVECSPPGAFQKVPSLKSMWKWIRRLTEEYMGLKNKLTNEEENRFIILKLMDNLGLEHPKDLHILRKRLDI
jgi:hypothetical protein